MRAITVIGVLCMVALVASGCRKPSSSDLLTYANAASPQGSGAPLVNPKMGSGGFGFAYGAAWPGAEVPNGMMRVAPDTYGYYLNLYALHFSGYRPDDNTVLAFSHMHLHGTGSQDYGVLGILPLTNFSSTQLSSDSYMIGYTAGSDTAWPGYYALTLDSGVKAEFTATTHAALERYTFPASSNATVLVDFSHHLQENGIAAASFTVNAAQNQIEGSLQTTGGMSGGFQLFYVIQFEQPWAGIQTWAGTGPAGSATTGTGAGGGAALSFDVSNGQPVLARVALSLVSLQGAEANLAAELTTWDFDTVRNAAVSAWNDRLNVVEIKAPSSMLAQVQTFYSTLHHAFVMPGTYNDTNAMFDYETDLQSASNFQLVTDISGWDVYRSLAPLYDLLAPDIAANVVSSLYTMAVVGSGNNYPKWPLATDDAGSMIGSAADVILSEAFLKGIPGVDPTNAYQRLRDAAIDLTLPPGEGRGGRNDDFSDYVQYDYVLAGTNNSSVSHTCEYNQDDFALSNFATKLYAATNAANYQGDATLLSNRSKGYQKLYDPSTGFLRAHDANGAIPDDSFAADNFGLAAEYVEADAYQTEFCPIWDVAGLAGLWGGNAPFVAGLEQLFENTQVEHAADLQAAASAPSSTDPNQEAINLPPTYYFAGNEPDIHYANEFALAGRPDLTQKWMPWVRATYFNDGNTGLPGNDDGGTMSAWYVWSSLGIFPIPGSDVYVIGSPAFPEADIKVVGGTFSVIANGVSPTNIYIQGAKLNGATLTAPTLHHSDLRAGGSLELEMGSKPSTWAVTN